MLAKRLREDARGADEPVGLALARDDVAPHAAATQQRAPRGYTAAAHSCPTDLAGQAAVLDLRAAVHDDLQAGGLRLGGGRVIAHAELHPDNLDAKFVLQADRLARDLQGRCRAAEDIDDVHRRWDVGKPREDRLAQDLLAGESRVYRDYAVAFAQKVLHGEVAWPIVGGTRAHHGDHARAAKDLGNVFVRVALVSDARQQPAARFGAGSGLGQPLGHTGVRFSMKAPMPSSDSACIMFCTMTPAA